MAKSMIDWPDIPYASWRDTLETLHLWTQIVGKTRLAPTPWLNHGWHVPLYVTARGLGTSAIHVRGELVEIEFDLVDHRLHVRSSVTMATGFRLEPMTVAEFRRRFKSTLVAMGLDVEIDETPNEVADAVPFSEDHLHASYDGEAVHRYWRALLRVDEVLKLFRTSFIGKASPVHLFWGSFDLAVTRFSGRAAPLHPGGVPGLPDAVAREAYSHEVSSAGFWPGDARFPEPAFYSYAYPSPPGFDAALIRPTDAFHSKELGEWILPYAAVRCSADPTATVMAFLSDTYRAAAQCGNWDLKLECAVGVPGVPRPLSSHGR